MDEHIRPGRRQRHGTPDDQRSGEFGDQDAQSGALQAIDHARAQVAATQQQQAARQAEQAGYRRSMRQIAEQIASRQRQSHELQAELKQTTERIDELNPTLPSDLRLSINMDTSVFIRESLKEVIKALALALALVLVVIYGFIGTIRATVIPAVTIPISLIAAFIVMNALGFSLNTLTMLGFVLAIGLVVDDAIVIGDDVLGELPAQVRKAGIPAVIGGLSLVGLRSYAGTTAWSWARPPSAAMADFK